MINYSNFIKFKESKVESGNWWETEEGHQWLQSQPNVEEMFKQSQPKPQKRYGAGNRFLHVQGFSTYAGGEYVLARITHKEVVLININTGNRWSDTIYVVDPTLLTEAEWAAVSEDGKFIFVEKKSVT